MKIFKENRGFTLFEVMIVIAVIGILLAIIIVNLRGFQKTKTVDGAASGIIEVLRYAQGRTLSSEGASSYGVHFETDRYVLFKGVAYNSSDSSNEIHSLDQSLEISQISLGGSSEVIFQRLTGVTDNSGSVKVQLISDVSQNKTIFIDASGAIGLSSLSPSDVSRIKDSRHEHVLYSADTTGALTLSFIFPNDGIAQDIDYQANMDVGKTAFSWEGIILVNGVNQEIRVHTHSLSSGSTLFCVHRDGRFNSKAVSVSLDGQNIINYAADGAVSQGSSVWAGAPEAQ